MLFFNNIDINIDTHRHWFMGVAMVLIVLFHLCSVWDSGFTLPFRRGFIGVDIFLLFSSYGLCYSWARTSWEGYFYKRVIRILPCFVLLAIIVSLLYIQQGNSLSIWDWFCNLTSLSYYDLGGFEVDWYLSGLLLLYMVSPVVININREYGLFTWIILIVLCASVLKIYEVELFKRCLIARLPIFMLGSVIWHSRGKDFRKTWIFVCIISTVLWAIGVFIKLDRFILADLFTPFLISLVSWIYNLLDRRTDGFIKKIQVCIEKIGKNSLEIYVGNCLAPKILSYITCVPIVLTITLYFIFTALLSYGVHSYNQFVQKAIAK